MGVKREIELCEHDLMEMDGEEVIVKFIQCIDGLKVGVSAICKVNTYGGRQVHCQNKEYDFYYIDGEQPEGEFRAYKILRRKQNNT